MDSNSAEYSFPKKANCYTRGLQICSSSRNQFLNKFSTLIEIMKLTCNRLSLGTDIELFLTSFCKKAVAGYETTLRLGGTARHIGASRSSNVGVDIDRSPHIDLVFVEFDAVGISLVPLLDDLALLELSDVGLHDIADLETEIIAHTAGHESISEELVVEVLSDKDKSGFTLGLGFGPLAFVETARKDHTDTLEDEFLFHSLHGQNSLVAIEVGSILCHQSLDPSLHKIDIYGISLHLAGNGGDGFVVHVLTVLVQKVGFEFQNTIQFKRLDIKEFLWTDLRLLGADHLDSGIELLDFLLDVLQFLVVRNQIDLVQQNLVGKRNLFDGFVLDAIWLLFLDAGNDVLGVNNGNDHIQSVFHLDVFV